MENNNENVFDQANIIVDLNALMAMYRDTTDAQKEACKELDVEIERLQEQKHTIASVYITRLEDIEAKMRQPMLDRKSTFVCAYGKINFRKGAVRRTWNLDALDQICNAKPEVKEEIWALREEKTGEPSISVKLE